MSPFPVCQSPSSLRSTRQSLSDAGSARVSLEKVPKIARCFFFHSPVRRSIVVHSLVYSLIKVAKVYEHDKVFSSLNSQ